MLLACFFVVVIHASFPGELGRICVHVGRFAVPFFFMISGFFTSDISKEQCVVVRKRAFRNLRSFAVCSTVYLLFHLVRIVGAAGIDEWVRDITSLRNVFNLVVFNWTTPYIGVGHLWFLLALSYVYFMLELVIHKDLMKYAKWYSIISIMFVMVLETANHYFDGFSVSSIWYRNAFLLGFPCFILGNHFGSAYGEEPLEDTKEHFVRFGLGLIIAGAVLTTIELGLSLDAFDLYPSSLALGLGILMFSVGHGRTKFTMLSKLGREYSSKIYAWHYLLIIFFTQFAAIDIPASIMPFVIFFGTMLWLIAITKAI